MFPIIIPLFQYRQAEPKTIVIDGVKYMLVPIQDEPAKEPEPRPKVDKEEIRAWLRSHGKDV